MKKKKIPYKKIWQYIMPFVRQYKWWLVAVMSVTVLGVFSATIVTPLVFREIIDVASGAVNDPQSATRSIFLLVLLLFVVRSFRTLFGTSEEFIDAHYASHVMRLMNNDVLSRLFRHSYRFYTNNFAGSLVAKSRRYVRAFRMMLDSVTYTFLRLSVELVGILVTLFIINRIFALVFTMWITTYMVVTVLLLRFRVPLELKRSSTDSLVTARLADLITNILNIKIFSSEEYEKKSFETVTNNEHIARSRAIRFGGIQTGVQGILMLALIVGGVYLSVLFWLEGKMTVGDIALVQTFVMALSRAMWDLGRNITKFMEALSDATEMIEIFEKDIDVKDTQNPQPLHIQAGHIIFKDVSFSYHEGEEVFENFNLEIQPGERIGLVGHSGSGKTTITNILLRFHDVQSGLLTIDGQNIYDVTQSDLRSVISYVPQDPMLFHRSIFENIQYAKKDASKEEVIEAAKKAFAHEFIEGLDQGYDTLVGERGVKLSGGQRQRIAIARVFLEDAPILILDEATSSLDSISEKHIQDAFETMTQNKTTLVVAHRLSTVQSLDRIIVLDDGKIIEQGTHAELMSKNAQYAKLWEHQQSVI
jgi:ATP-binding cassette subfamily B protein